MAGKTPEEQIRLSERDFLAYLQNGFFVKPGAMYMVWQVDENYVSALRLEQYRDGLIMEALETIPDKRRKGYAVALISSVQQWLRNRGGATIYSHISKKNVPSLKTHTSCGFEVCQNYSVYSNGIRNENAYTMRCVIKQMIRKGRHSLGSGDLIVTY